MILNYKYLSNDTLNFWLNNEDIENVRIFRYLGDDIKFDEPSTGDAEIDLRIAVSEGKFYEEAPKPQDITINTHQDSEFVGA